MIPGSGNGRIGAAAVGLGVLLAACGASSGGSARATSSTRARASTAATWAAGITTADAAAGTGTQGSGISPWLAPPPAPALTATPGPAAPAGSACSGLRDSGWKAECVRVDTGTAVLTGVVESRPGPGAADLPVWRVAVWTQENQGGPAVETLAAGDPTTPLWAWAAVRSSDLLGNGHRELVFGFENEGTGGVLDLDVVGADGRRLLGSQISVYKGAATVSGGRILTYHPVYRDTDPNCCPTGGADQDTLELGNGQWTLTGSRPVRMPGAADHGFPDDFGPPRLS